MLIVVTYGANDRYHLGRTYEEGLHDVKKVRMWWWHISLIMMISRIVKPL